MCDYVHNPHAFGAKINIICMCKPGTSSVIEFVSMYVVSLLGVFDCLYYGDYATMPEPNPNDYRVLIY